MFLKTKLGCGVQMSIKCVDCANAEEVEEESDGELDDDFGFRYR